MHPLGIACSILDATHSKTAPRPESQLVRVGVHIGVLSSVDALRFAFGDIIRIRVTIASGNQRCVNLQFFVCGLEPW